MAAALAWWILGFGKTRKELDAPEPPPEPVVTKEEPQWSPRERTQPAPGCAPEAERRCLGGDPWWYDSCGQPYEPADECGMSLCREGECEPEPEPDCGGLSAIGECDGDIARACPAGHPLEIDCAAAGKRCVMDREGPLCRAPTDHDCDWPEGATRCDGDELLACDAGRLARFDCMSMGARCVTATPIAARCLIQKPPAPADAECGARGCDPDADVDEICDGRDNDGDGFIDEDGCEPVDIVAFVIADDDGEASYTQDDLAEELIRINRAFSREDDYGLEFRIAETILVTDSELLEFDEPEFDYFVEHAIFPPREKFFVPILFTDEVVIEDVPRPGASTVPNGMCGGKRRLPGPQPKVGMVAIAKRRWGTTVAHEIGHFLGLCHTHGGHPDAVQTAVTGEEGDAESCEPSCVLEADGVCDTPVDPGPAKCKVLDPCVASCRDGSAPDVRNIMGYYPDCRAIFSEQQMLLMRRTLALRRGWHACFAESGCPCEPGGECPEQMSCRAFGGGGEETTWKCALDGHALPGGRCRGVGDCSLGSSCMKMPQGSVCVRICNDETPCDCQLQPGAEWPLCMDDIAAAQESGALEP